MAISFQSGIREYNGDLSQYTGMLGGLTPDIHTLRSLNPETTNRVICVMYRGPFFLMHYMNPQDAYDPRSPFGTYKKIIEYYNIGIQANIGDATLSSTQLQGGFAGRTIPIPTTQNTQQGQQLTISVPELVGRPIANIHNMWIDGIADQITGLTTYHGLVAGSVDESNVPHRIFAPNENESAIALEPSPAWEVAEFLIIALDRSGARVEGAVAALGCVPAAKVGNAIFNSNAQGTSEIQKLDLTYNCQFVQSAYINDLATRYVKQFAVFGNALNYNPGAGDAFFKDATSTKIDHAMFNNGERPYLDAVQSGLGNAPVMYANPRDVEREAVNRHAVNVEDHSRIWTDNSNYKDIRNPYEGVPNI